MRSFSRKTATLGGMCLAVLGTYGVSFWKLAAEDTRKPAAPAVAAAADPKAKPGFADEAAIRKTLALPAPEIPDKITLKEFVDFLFDKHELVIRLDVASFRRLNYDPTVHMAAIKREQRFLIAHRVNAELNPDVDAIMTLYDHQLRFPNVRGLRVADLLDDAIAQLMGKLSYRIQGSQILIGPAYRPATVPGSGANPNAVPELLIESRLLMEQMLGAPISTTIEDQPYTEAVKTLRVLTGANIVLDARCKEAANQKVSATFTDVRLLTALATLADMCELKVVAMNNIYYITNPENAEKLQEELNRDLYGPPPPPQAFNFPGQGMLGFSGGPIAPPPTPPQPEKK